VTWHDAGTALSIGLVLLGLLWLALRAAQAPRMPVDAQLRATRPRPELHVSARELGLAHRFASRVVGSSERPADDDFTAIVSLWPYVPSTWRVLPDSGPRAVAIAYARPAGVFLVLEDLLERVESLTARLRTRRRRGQS